MPSAWLQCRQGKFSEAWGGEGCNPSEETAWAGDDDWGQPQPGYPQARPQALSPTGKCGGLWVSRCDFREETTGNVVLSSHTVSFLLLLWSTTFKYHLKYLSVFAYRNYKMGYFVFMSSPKVSLLFTHQKNESLFNKYSLESNFIISKSRPVWMGQVIKKKRKKKRHFQCTPVIQYNSGLSRNIQTSSWCI